MSEEDIDVVRAQFEGVNERDFQRVMNLYADDVVLVVHDSFGIESGSFEGKEAVGEWFGNWFRMFSSDYRFEIDDAREIGEVIFVAAHHGGSGRASGAEVSDEAAYNYRVRRGKVTYVEVFRDRDEALKAAESRG